MGIMSKISEEGLGREESTTMVISRDDMVFAGGVEEGIGVDILAVNMTR